MPSDTAECASCSNRDNETREDAEDAFGNSAPFSLAGIIIESQGTRPDGMSQRPWRVDVEIEAMRAALRN